jgi:hypothetical protein
MLFECNVMEDIHRIPLLVQQNRVGLQSSTVNARNYVAMVASRNRECAAY